MKHRRNLPKTLITVLMLASAFTIVFSYYGLPVPVYAQAITLTPNAGGAGTTVAITGVGFGSATSCSISSTGPASLITSPTCSMSGGTISSASFVVVSNPTPGSYQITVTGNPGSLKATASFSVPSVTITPLDGPTGTSESVTGSGFSSSATGCTSITSTTAGLVTSPVMCSIVGGAISVAGTFVIGPGVSPGTYTIIITTDDNERVTSTVKVDTTPQISLNPVLGPPLQVVQVSQNGGQFSTADTSCTITGSIVTSPSCVIVNGKLQSTSKFQVSVAAAPGPYLITVTGSVSGATASATFTVTSFVPTIVVTPSDGPLGTKINVQGTGFSSSDGSCQITSLTLNLVTSQSCSIGGGKVTGSFTVGLSVSVNTGYSITVTGNTGDSAFTSFTDDGVPVLLFTPASPQPPGTSILLTFSSGQFSTGDTATCTITSSPGGLFSSSACVVSTGQITGTFFVIGNVQAGKTYVVTVKGSLGDSASDSFTVSSATVATIFLSPTDAPPNSRVTVSGVGFPGQDFLCTLTSTGPSLLFAATPAPTCSISSGTISGSFTVATGASGPGYTIIVTSSSGKTASAAFTADLSPTLAFNAVPTPGSGSPGQNIQVTIATGQLSSASTSCSISSSPGGLFASSACHVAGLGTDLTGTFFVVAAVPTASSYQVIVKGNFGDTAVGTFTITVTQSFALTPSFGSPDQTISFLGRGLQFTDTSCTLTSTHDPGNGANLIASQTCSISSGTATGTFVVDKLATVAGNAYTVTLTGNPGSDALPTATFTVAPNITLSPTSGVAGTVVSVTGFGFSSAATTCSIASFPAVVFTTVGCNLIVPGPTGNGQVSGTFVFPAGTLAGSYVITVTDSKTAQASAVFVYGSPSASLTISPNNITPPVTGGPFSVAATGSGYNGADTSCTVTVSAPITVSGTCSMSGGTASATLLIPVATPSGLYLVTITGTPSGDFASNYLAVNAITTMTSTIVTTTVSTTVTSTSTTSTTTGTSTSFSTTTQQTTGFSSWIFTQGALTTIFAQTTAYLVTTTISTSSTVFTQTATITTTFTHTLGQITRPIFHDDVFSEYFGLLALLSLGVSMLKRRLR